MRFVNGMEHIVLTGLWFMCSSAAEKSGMAQALSNWLNHIKSDDIDGGLAADFDGSFSGLGSELGSNPYNMRLLMVDIFVCKSTFL